VAGAVFVFTRSAGVWTQQAELAPSDGESGDNFGTSVSLQGNTLVAGAPGKNSGTGSAYVFNRAGNVWSQQTELTASNGAAGDTFGASVWLSGDTAAVGAPGNNNSTGAVYAYTVTAGMWSQQAELTASNGGANDEFGFSVSLDGNTLIAGAPYRNFQGSGARPLGAAYAFTRTGTAWKQQGQFLPSDDGQAGYSVAVSGGWMLAGQIPAFGDTVGGAEIGLFLP
jgi:hypothetical protein